MAGKIFINYRRGDDPGNTGRLFDRLQDAFEPQQLFLDVDNIAPGLDFVRVLNERVAECDIVLAVIGKGWIDARDANGARRLDDSDDFVRIEISSALSQGKRVIPVLVGGAQMPRPDELPEALRPLARRNAVRLTHEQFGADMQGLVKALQQTLVEIDALQQAQAEAARSAQAEQERRRQESEAARLAEEVERNKKAEAEARERAAEERRRQEAAAKQRVEAERAFTAAKRVGTVLALDAFLTVYPENSFADEARKLKAGLLAREGAYHRTSASDDPAVLRSFLATYKTGDDVDQVRRRLRLLEPQQRWQLPKPAIIVPGTLAAVVIVAALAFWIEYKPSPSNQQALAVPTSLSATPVPAPDEVAWSLLKDTTDEAALKRFTARYPNSALRTDAEARIAVIEAAQAAKPAPPPPEQIAWDLVKDSKDPDQLRRFVEQFPNSAQRPDAEQRISALSASAQKVATSNAPDPHELARALQFELQRVGCFIGTVNGDFDDATKTAWHKFINLTSITMPDDASSDAINAVRGITKRVCPLECQAGEHAEGELCVGNAPPPKHATTNAEPSRPSVQPSQHPERGSAVVNNSGAPPGKVTNGGVTTCGQKGCQFVPKNCYAVTGQGGHGLGGKIICP